MFFSWSIICSLFTFQNYNVFVCFFIDERTRHYTANVLKHCLTAIQEWWKAMNYDSPYIVSSIHLCICLKEFDVNDNNDLSIYF